MIFRHVSREKSMHFDIPAHLRVEWMSRLAEPRRVLADGGKLKEVDFSVNDCHEVVPMLDRIIERGKHEIIREGYFAALFRMTT